MSYTEYLRTKLASQPKIMAVRKPTDASVYTRKKRMAATGLFSFVDGTSVGTLVKQTDRPVLNNAAVSSKKQSKKVPSASDFTTYAGSRASAQDIIDQAKNGKKNTLVCCAVSSCNDPKCGTFANGIRKWNYASASDSMRSRKCVDSVSGVLDSPGAPLFQDNTISLSAMHPQKAIGCDGNSKLEDANHTHSPGLNGKNSQPYAVGKPFFMRSPPQPQTENTSPLKVGSYYSPLSGYVENKHGYVKPTAEVPKAPGPQGQEIAHLNINRPTLFSINPVSTGECRGGPCAPFEAPTY